MHRNQNEKQKQNQNPPARRQGEKTPGVSLPKPFTKSMNQMSCTPCLSGRPDGPHLHKEQESPGFSDAGPWARLLGFKSYGPCFPDSYPWGSHLTSLGLTLYICKTNIKAISSPRRLNEKHRWSFWHILWSLSLYKATFQMSGLSRSWQCWWPLSLWNLSYKTVHDSAQGEKRTPSLLYPDLCARAQNSAWCKSALKD